MASIEEKVEEHYKKVLDDLCIRHYGKNEAINDSISKALKETDSKSGGAGRLHIKIPFVTVFLRKRNMSA